MLTLDMNGTEGFAEYIDRMADPLNPYGSDPVFVSDTALYNPKMVDREAEFYNMTSGSKDANIFSSPNGFFHRPMAGMPDGFPVVIPPSTDLYRTAVLHAAMEGGNYLDTRTTSLSLQLSTYNSKLKTMMFGTATFSWRPAGLISYTVSPARTVPASLPNASDISMIVVLFGLAGVLSYISGIANAFPVLALRTYRWLKRRIRDLRRGKKGRVNRVATRNLKAALKGKANNIAAGERSDSSPLCLKLFGGRLRFDERAVHSQSSECSLILFRMSAGIPWPASTTGFYFDGTILCLMLAGWLTYTVALALEKGMTAAASYRIYDDVTTSAARFFMPSKMEADADAVVEDLGIDSAGNDERWRLPDDDSGFDELSEMTASLAHVSSVVTLSFSLHGIALLLAVLRLLYSFTFQPRFGIISDALLLSVPGLYDLMIIASVVLILLISLCHLIMGDLWWELSTMSGSLHFAYVSLLTGATELGDMKKAVAPFYYGMERNTVSLVVGYIAYAALPLFFGFIMMQFMIAVIFVNYYKIKQDADEPPSMFVEAGEIVRGRKRLRLLRRGFAAVGIIRRVQTNPLDASSTMGSSRGKTRGRNMPKKPEKPKMVRDKLMLANLAQAIEILTLQGIPSALQKKRLRLTSYRRLLEFVAQNEILLSDVTMMVEEVFNMVDVMEIALHNPKTMVTAVLKRMVALSKPWIPRMMTRFDALPPDKQEEKVKKEAIAEELTRYRQRMVFKLATESPHDLFDELCEISSGAKTMTTHRPITPYTVEASWKLRRSGRAAASSQKSRAQKQGLDALQQWRRELAAESASDAKMGGLGVVAPATDPVEGEASRNQLQKLLAPFRRNQVKDSPQSSVQGMISIAGAPAARRGRMRHLLGQAMMQAARVESAGRQSPESRQPSVAAGQHFRESYRRMLSQAMMQAARLESAKERLQENLPPRKSLEQKANASRRRQENIAIMEAARLEGAADEKLPGPFQVEYEANTNERRQLGTVMKRARFSTGDGSSSSESLLRASQQFQSCKILPSYSPSNGSVEGLMKSMGSYSLAPGKQPGPSALRSHRASDSSVLFPSGKPEGRKGKIGTRRGSTQSVYTDTGEIVPRDSDAPTGRSTTAPSKPELLVPSGRSSSITISHKSSATQPKASQVVPDGGSSGGAKAPLKPCLKTATHSHPLSVPGKAEEDLEAEVLEGSWKVANKSNRTVSPLMMLEGDLAINPPEPEPSETTDTTPLAYPGGDLGSS